MSKLDFEKRNRKEKLTFVPSPRSEPPSQAQLDYITNLHHQKGQRLPRYLPKTKQGASNMIDRLKALPDVNKYQRVRLAVVGDDEPSDYQKMLIEWQESLNLTPMTIRSLVHVFSQVDDVGTGFFFEGLMYEELPEDPDALLIHILRRFVEDFAE